VSELYGDASLAVLERQIDEWLATMAAADPTIEAVDRGEGDEPRWYVRMRGEEKEFTTVWLTLGQRTLRYETYVMPAPLDNAEQLYELALRANAKLVGAHFAIGVEDAVFLVGELPLRTLDEAELDRIVGSLYAYVERHFPAMIRLGYARHFRNDA
jgi:Putative bacterial sensory transduction regulator